MADKIFLARLMSLSMVFVLLEAREEPLCYSTFDYQEKLLTKLIKLEHKVHLMQEKETIRDRRIEELENRLTGCMADVQRLDSVLVGASNRTMVSKDKPLVGFHSLGLRNLTPKVGDKLVFWKVKFNMGRGYDVNTGIFTAPVDGLYWFSTQICNNENLGMQFLITVNDNPMTNSIKYGSVNTCSSGSMATHLSSGGRVFVQTGHIGNGGQVLFENVHRECMFSGVLVN